MRYTTSKLNIKECLGWVLGTLFTAGAIIFLSSYFTQAFPEHQIDFKLNRSQAYQASRNFLESHKLNVSGFRHAIIFDIDEPAKTFLERTIGFDSSARLFQNEMPIWYWSTRWFQPLNREEFRVALSPAGQIVEFEHILPEEAATLHSRVSRHEARQIARNFMLAQKIDADEWQLVETRSEAKPERTDHFLTFRNHKSSVANAEYRIEVTIQGDAVGKYRRYLKLPETWQRAYQRLRSANLTTALAADIGAIAMIIAAGVVFFRNLKRRNLRLKAAIWFGVLTIVIQLIAMLNLIPISIFQIDSNQSLVDYFGQFTLAAVMMALLYGLLVFLVTAAGENLIRTTNIFPHISLSQSFSRNHLRSKQFLIEAGLGLALAFIFLAFQTGFYLIAKRWGAWSPADVSYSNVLNAACPALFVLMTGFIPAVTEEFLFRLFTIPFLLKITRSKAIAVIVPALIWGFAHANYPNQPFWIRGMEVSLFGILIGIVFLKTGVVTLLIWHYTVDALYAGLVLFKSGDWLLIISGGLVAGLMLLPLLYNLFHRLKYGHFTHDDTATVAAIPEIIQDVQPQIAPQPALLREEYLRLHPRRIRLALIIITGTIVIGLSPGQSIGNRRMNLTRRAAMTIARSFVAERDTGSAKFMTSVRFTSDIEPQFVRYILQHSSLDSLNYLIENYLDGGRGWQVRFFEPLSPTEYQITVNPLSGAVSSFSHIVPEENPGAKLTPRQARRLAEKFLQQRQIDLQKLRLIDSKTNHLKHRTDHIFVWESSPQDQASIGQGRLRHRVIVRGKEISEYRVYYKLPEEWITNETARTTYQTIWEFSQIALLVSGIFLIVRYLLRHPPGMAFNWSIPVRVAFFIGLLYLINALSAYREARWDYATSWNLSAWTAFWFFLVILKTLAAAGLSLMMTAGLVYLYPNLPAFFSPIGRRGYSRDAIVGALTVSCGILALHKLVTLAILRYRPPLLAEIYSVETELAAVWPWLNIFVSTALRALLYLAVIGLFLFLLSAVLHQRWRQLAVLTLVAALFQTYPNGFGTDFWFGWLINAVYLGWGAIGVVYFLRRNLLAYLLAVTFYLILNSGLNLFAARTPGGYYQMAIVFGVLMVALAWYVTAHRREALKI